MENNLEQFKQELRLKEKIKEVEEEEDGYETGIYTGFGAFVGFMGVAGFFFFKKMQY
jgi:hypothetical protein